MERERWTVGTIESNILDCNSKHTTFPQPTDCKNTKHNDNTYLAKLAFRELLIVTKDLCSMEYTDLQFEAVTHKLLHEDL